MAISYLQYTGAAQAELVAKKARKGADAAIKGRPRHFKWKMVDERGQVVSGDPTLYRQRREESAAVNRQLRENGTLPLPSYRKLPRDIWKGKGNGHKRGKITLAIVNLPPVD